MADGLKILLAYRISTEAGIPDYMTYFISGTFVAPIEKGLTMYPSFVITAKLIPKGIESTMIAFSNTIISVN